MTGPASLNVETLEEWKDLPEIAFPTIRDGFQKGSIYTVHKVGFLAATPQDCAEAGIVGKMEGYGGKCILPTAVIEFEGAKKLCRLPLGLGGWVLQSVQMAHAGLKGFPAEVEFGILQGRTYAEMQ